MDRRTFISGLASAVVAPNLMRAQARGKVWRIGYLREGKNPIDPYFWVLMREYGWVEGQNVALVPRYASVQEELPVLAAELVELNVDMILANGNPAALAAKQATQRIPVLFVVSMDPVERGLVASLARPGGNVTGFTYGYYAPKMLEILKLTLPKIAWVALPARYLDAALVDAAKTLGVRVSNTRIQRPEDIAPFYLAAREAGIDAVLIPSDIPAWALLQWPRMVAEAARNRLPCIAHFRDFVEIGGLMSYGPIPQHWRSLAPQIDKVFKGVKPADIPVQLATRFELVINLKTAKSLGITIPQSILLRADEVIR